MHVRDRHVLATLVNDGQSIVATARRTLAAHILDREQDGLIPAACMSRALESGLGLRLLEDLAMAPHQRSLLTGFLRWVKRTADADGPDQLLARVALRETTLAADAASIEVAALGHFTADRKQLLAQAIVKIFGGRPQVAAMAYDRTRLHSWAKAYMTAAEVILQPEHATPAQVAELRATQAGPGIWDRYVLCHLLVLHALRRLPGHEAMVHRGVDKLLTAQRPDGGFPLVLGDTLFSTAHVGIALAALSDGPRRTVLRLADTLARQQRDDGGWAYDAGVAQTDVDDTAVVMEALRAAGPTRYRGHLTRGLEYLQVMRGDDGGFPTYTAGAPSEDAMTAAAANAVDPGESAARPIVAGAVSFLAGSQRPDGSFEPGWHRSGAHVVCRAVLAMRAAGQLTDRRLAAAASKVTRGCAEYLHGTCNADGGWGQQQGEPSDPVSTALALIALTSATPESPLLAGGIAYLLGQQHTSGGYTSRPGMYGPRGIVYDVPVHACMYPLLALAHLEAVGTARHASLPAARPAPFPAAHLAVPGCPPAPKTVLSMATLAPAQRRSS